MHAMHFWPETKHSTNNDISIRSPQLEAFYPPLYSIEVTHKHGKQIMHTHKLIKAKISMRARKEKKTKKKREIITWLVLDSCSCVSSSLLFT